MRSESEVVKSCVESRKNAIFSAYVINNEELKAKIDELFTRIEELANECSSVTDFETKFAVSELNQEYISLFTEISKSCSQITYEPVQNPDVKSDGQYVADEVKSEMEYQLKEMSMPARRAVRQRAYDNARETPIIGDAMNIKQHFDFFARFANLFKKKDKKQNEETRKDSSSEK